MSSTRIHALPLHLANQIAAGEVVERPASVLKELVENSIDAGATQIDIRIEGAGNGLIKVTDNGNGIHPEDLPLALSRHATSKLLNSQQLSEIGSLGFRGEALPSIASVSNLTLSSKQADQDCGWEIKIDQTKANPTAHPNGTTVCVSELFFNLPARKRFLRSDKTETHHLLTSFQRLALSRFDIGFTAIINQSNQFKLPALTQTKDYPQRIAKICGLGFLKQASYLEQVYEEVKLSGWVSQPEAHRAQTDIQFFFINGRVIKDRVINHAIRQAYEDKLPSGRQAAYVLYLTMPLNKIDVNVHPTKHEVRFHDARLIHGLITKAIQEAIQNQPALTQQAELSIDVSESLMSSQPQVKESTIDYAVPNQLTTTKSPTINHSDNVNGTILLHQRYMVCNSPSPRLIDLQLADKMLKQKQFKEAVISNTLAARPILVPVDISITEQQQILLKSKQSQLEQLGFGFIMQTQQVRLTRIPFLLSQIELNELVKGILQLLSLPENDSKSLSDSVAQLIPMQAIQSKQQAQTILEQLLVKPDDFNHCFQTLDLDTLSSLFSDA